MIFLSLRFVTLEMGSSNPGKEGQRQLLKENGDSGWQGLARGGEGMKEDNLSNHRRY